MITRSLGPNASVDVDVEGPFPVQEGDQFLICSDGLTGLVKDEEIGILLECLPQDQAVRVLVDLANLRGGPDNITVVIVRATRSSEGVTASAKKPAKEDPPMVPPLLLGGTILCFLIAAVLGGLALGGQSRTVGGMVVMLLLGVIAAAFSIAAYIKNSKQVPVRPTQAGARRPIEAARSSRRVSCTNALEPRSKLFVKQPTITTG